MKALYCFEEVLAVERMHQVGLSHLLIPNGEFALGFLVVLRKGLQFLDCLILHDCGEELNVLFSVLVAGLYSNQQSDQGDCFARESHVDLGVVG